MNVEIQPKKRNWLRYMAIAGLCLVVYQCGAIGLSLARHFNLALILYTFEIIIIVVLAIGSILLLKRSGG